MPIINKKPEPAGILSSGQKKILEAFFDLRQSDFFCLSGGNALSEFYLGHRKSFDLDFITGREDLILEFSRNLEKKFAEFCSIRVPRRFETFAEVEAGLEKEKVKIHLAYESPFRFSEPVKIKNLIVNNYLDLITDKFLAFYGRAEARDAVDLYFILTEEKIDFWELSEYAKKKDQGYDLYWMAAWLEKAQKLPDQLERWPVEMIKALEVKALKELFRKIADEILEKITKK